MRRKSYKVTKRTTKTEKIEKSLKILKMYDVIKFRTIRYKQTATCKIFHSILNYKLMKLWRPVSFLRLNKEKKKDPKRIQKKIELEKWQGQKK